MSDTDVHTCHSQCPCHTGGEPMTDFLPVESFLPLYRETYVLASITAAQREASEAAKS